MKIEFLKEKFSNFKGYSFIRLNLEIKDYKMFLKEKKELNSMVKKTIGVYLIGPDSYKRMVKNKHTKLETGFEYVSHERKWGIYLDDSKTIVHHINKANEEKFYLQVIPIQIKSEYFLNGEPFNPFAPELKEFLLSEFRTPQSEKISKSQNLRGLDIIRINDISIENIKQLKYNGVVYGN